MNALPVSIVYTGDSALLQRLSGFLLGRSDLRPVADPADLELVLKQYGSVLLFMDLRGPDCRMLLPRIVRDFPGVVIIAMGAPRSDPGLEAAAAGVYAVEPGESDRLRLQTLFEQARAHLQLQQENRLLRSDLQRASVSPHPENTRERIAPLLDHFSGAFRRFDNVGIMLESIVEGVAGCARVSRVALFTVTPAEVYRFRAGVKCMPETRTLEFKAGHPFVQWLTLHAHSISRPMLRHIEPVGERMLLERMLDLAGAEILLPLYGRERLIGWLALGRPSSGMPFEPRDIEALTLLAEQVSVTIENSLLHETLAIQKALAENLLQAIPVGIVAAGADGAICWFNHSAEKLLNTSAAGLIGQPVSRLSSHLASLLNSCISGGPPAAASEWTEPLSRRKLSIQTRCLNEKGNCIGAMAILQDLTEEEILREKQNNLERAQFWNELAKAISHEVRNPLVAISTFSQLLPERYADEEFRNQFRDLTAQEVDRLNGMIDQLDEYASPPKLKFGPVAVKDMLENALCTARQYEQPVKISTDLDVSGGLPPVHGDADVLTDAVVRLLLNAFTAVAQVPSPHVLIKAYGGEIGTDRPAVVIEIRDNGGGISEKIRDKIFSPFCTTKARGVGLGLPIVRRTMIDHGGLVTIDGSGSGGTVVRLTLPVAERTTEGAAA